MNTAETFVEHQKQLGKKSNRLIQEKSPYLLQHAFNPVDWYPWGEEAFTRARKEEKPIFLSVGYSTCYWCHVMEREVFENPDIAKLMNEYFVNIKVDREERPDVDRVYMAAVQAMTGSGGWPMSVFLTPDRDPFFGTTYIPPVSRGGRMGFVDLAERIHELWSTQRQRVVESGKELTAMLRRAPVLDSSFTAGEELFTDAAAQLLRQHDRAYGGFGGSPKFPRPVNLNFLFRYFVRTGDSTALDASLLTLRRMAEGGMYDHLGGGFHRYSVDDRWRVPHFEKMLYDQGLLVEAYLAAYQITRDAFYSDVAQSILGYVVLRMSDEEGGFYSAEDAESATDPANPETKVEGEFYLWRKTEIVKILGKDAGEIFCHRYGVEEDGNTLFDPHGVFGNKNVLYAAHTIDETAKAFGKSTDEIRRILRAGEESLLAAREQRPRPHLDDKILTSWNGLMISAFARAYQVLGRPEYLDAGLGAARFVSTRLYDVSRRQLLHRYRDGEARFDANLQDYAFLIMGFLDLYESSFDPHWLQLAIDLTGQQAVALFDDEGGGFWDTTAKDTSILVRTKEDYDGAEPTGNSVAAINLLRLSQITENGEWVRMAQRTFQYFGGRLKQVPLAMPQMLVAVDFSLAKPKQIIIAGKRGSPDTQDLAREVWSRFMPNKILLLVDGSGPLPGLNAFLTNLPMRDGKATAYVCEDYVCALPVTDRPALARQLREFDTSSSTRYQRSSPAQR